MLLGKVLILVSSINAGDKGNIDAVMKALQKTQEPRIEQVTIDTSKPQTTIREAYEKVVKSFEKPYVTLAVGPLAADALIDLSQQGLLDEQSYIYFGLHQYMAQLERLPKNVHVALPEATVDTPAKRTMIESFPHRTFTLTVPASNPTRIELEDAYNKWQDAQKPALDGQYIIVMLPGDAPDSENKMHYFTKSSTTQLFRDVHALWEKLGKTHTVIVQNGPRTGKHDPEDGKVVGTHEFQKGSDPSVAIDPVSTHFVSQLTEAQIPHTFFNFAFEMDGAAKKALSVFNPLLYLALKSGAYFVVPGESVSMLGQIPLYLAPDHIIGFKPDSMNADHDAIFNQGVEKKFLSYFDDKGQVVTPAHPVQRTHDDATVVADAILMGYKEIL